MKKRHLAEKRKKRVRASLKGTRERPRLSIFRSNRYIYAQIIDDEEGKTLASCSLKEVKEKSSNKKEMAEAIGNVLAKKALKKGIKKVIFDRGSFAYHGRVAALAEGARKGGLKF